ncbi:unnamed protein product [Urochloa decumbens]|uniref:Protein kinase domain-containing protein n=1 Tax=Urochloa decumbens TaxID=240449 RepID=A0ABC8XYV6_9POAL
MGWVERVKTALFVDGGVLGCCLCVSKNNPPTADDPAEPAAELLISPGSRAELTLRELNKATDSFSAARLMRQGYGNWREATVYRATLRPIGTAAVAKVLGTPPSGRWGSSEDAFLRQQVSLLSALRHDNLVRLLGYTIGPDLRVLLFEFATAGTLHDVLHGPRGEPQPGSSSGRPAVTLSWAQRVRIALDAARGLQYLHEAAAVGHWGVRSTNVLLFEGFRAKIADYDVFQQPAMEEQTRDMCAEHPRERTCYLPPEYIRSGHRIIDYKTDVYSFGVVLLELLTGRKPDDVTPHSRTLVQWATPMLSKGRVKRCIDPKLISTRYPPAGALKLGRIALHCLHHDRRSRPSMGAVTQMISGIIGD